MSAPIFVEPVDNTMRSLKAKGDIKKLVIKSDSELKSFYHVIEHAEYSNFAKLKPSNDSLEFLNNMPHPVVNKFGNLQHELDEDSSAVYTIPFNGAGLVNGKNYLIYAYNYDSDYREYCTIKVLRVFPDGKVLIETPERLRDTTLSVISIVNFKRRAGNKAYIDCSGATTSPLATVILTEQNGDDLPQVYQAMNVVLGPPTWSCSFLVGNYGIDQRTFTLYVTNTAFESAQMTKKL